jgi:hypothetical protein
MMILIIFLVSLIQNYLAARQIYSIAQSEMHKSAIWAGLTSTASCASIILIAQTPDSWNLLPPYVLGDIIATYLALYRRTP